MLPQSEPWDCNCVCHVHEAGTRPGVSPVECPCNPLMKAVKSKKLPKKKRKTAGKRNV